MKKKENRSVSTVITFRMSLLFLLGGGLLLLMLFLIQYQRMERAAFQMVKSNVKDATADITHLVEDEMDDLLGIYFPPALIDNEAFQDPQTLSDRFQEVGEDLGVEFDLVNEDGVIVSSSDAALVGYDLHDDPRMKDFLKDMEENGTSETDDFYMSIFESSVPTLYSGIRLPYADGYIMTGVTQDHYSTILFQESMDAVTNRRIGETGFLLLCDDTFLIMDSYHDDNSGKTLSEAGIVIDPTEDYDYRVERCAVSGEPSFVCINRIQDIYLIGVLPVREAEEHFRILMSTITLVIVLLIALLYVSLFMLIRISIVNDIAKVTHSLAKITAGDLEEQVDVRGSTEFDSLSTDINRTVEKLKGYIAEAESRFDVDLENARIIQFSSLPKLIATHSGQPFELFADMKAAKVVGGDFYDFFYLTRDTLGFLIADVSGKGIPAAMFMMRSKALMKGYAESGLTPAEVFGETNKKLCEGNDSNMFVTAWMGYLNLHTGEICFVNAGHNKPVLIREGRSKPVYGKTELILGFREEMLYSDQKLQLQQGDILYLYTDGVTEAVDSKEELFGENRLLQLLSYGETPPEPDLEYGLAGAVCGMVARDLKEYAKGVEQSDDITMLCIRYLGNP